MTKYKKFKNLKTGESEFSFNASLLDLGENVIQNSNVKNYRIVMLGFQLPSGDEMKSLQSKLVESKTPLL
jgi:hypothetical protein